MADSMGALRVAKKAVLWANEKAATTVERKADE
jgi:hypothetical protein